MAWTTGNPQDTWQDREKMAFLREVYTRHRFSAFTWDPPSVGGLSAVDTTLTTATDARLAQLRVGMHVSVTPPYTGLTTGLVIAGSWVPNDGELVIRLYNPTA